MMQAAVRTRYGPAQEVRVLAVPRPVPGPRELLVEVQATTVNRTDCGYRAGKPFVVRVFAGLPRPRRSVLGNEFAGRVEMVGDEVTAFQPGDRVFGYVEGRFGGHAEYLTVGEDASIARVPDGVDLEAAAAATEGAHYALAFLRVAKIQRGDEVLVYGATGAIGSAAVQLLKEAGAWVTAVCATPSVDLVRGLGADRVVDYTVQDFTRDERRYDAVLDAVGKSTFAACRPLLKPRGVYLSSELGPHGQNVPLAMLAPLRRGRQRVLFPFPKHDQAMIRRLADLLGSGSLRPVIDRRYPLDRIVEAYQYVESGQKIGNVVITPRGDGSPETPTEEGREPE